MRLLIALLTLTTCATALAEDATYEHFFQRRADHILRATAARDTDAMIEWFDQVDYFQGAGGDRHKYILPPIIAKLHLDPEDASALRAYRMLMEVDKQKGDRGLYHFAAFQRARLYGQMRDQLPEDVVESNEYDVRNFFHILDRGGTENHEFMHRGSALIFAELVEGEYAGDKTRDQRLADMRQWLRYQVRRMYNGGLGEYDSSTYITFSAASLANVYDFTEDEATRLWAKAGLDWIAAAMARKYFHGLTAGPEARGFAKEAVGNIDQTPSYAGATHLKYEAVGAHTDWGNWLWFGDSRREVIMDEPGAIVTRFPTLNLAMSDYRPHPIIRAIANKDVALPYASRGSKPSYYGTDANKDQEHLYVADDYMMGTLYSPEKGVRTSGTILPQTTMFKLAVKGEHDVHVFGMANGYHGHFPLEGRGPFDQYAQMEGLAVMLTHVAEHDRIDADRVKKQSLFGYPARLTPVEKDGWWILEAGEVFIAVHPMGGEVSRTVEDDYGYLVNKGANTGFVVRVIDDAAITHAGDAAAAVAERVKVDFAMADGLPTVQVNDSDHTLSVHHTGGPGGRPEVTRDGEALEYEKFPVYDSPYMKQAIHKGRLWLSDGQRTLTIDVTGDVPTWTEGTAGDGE